MNYKLEQVLPGQVRLLFELDKEDTFEKHKIGHVRGDFGRSGDQFFSTWFPVHEELKTQRCCLYKESDVRWLYHNCLTTE